jgi:hypothetical protein
MQADLKALREARAGAEEARVVMARAGQRLRAAEEQGEGQQGGE